MVAMPARFLRQAALVAIALGCVPARTSSAQSLWEFDPYRLQLVVAVASRPELSGGFTARLTEGLIARADAYIGAAWTIEATPAKGSLASRIMHSLDTFTKEHLPDNWRSHDKVMLVRVDYERGQYLLAFREFDVLTEQWQAAMTRTVRQQPLLVEEAFRGLLATFAPIAEIESADDKVVTLRWKAGALASRDPKLVLTPPGLIIHPFVRSLDRAGRTRKVQAIEWTYLVARKNEGGYGEAAIYSGLRGALTGKRRGRVQPLALAVRYEPDPTRLELRARTEDARPLPGYEVYAYAPDDPKTILVGHTDRQGAISIPPGPAPAADITDQGWDRAVGPSSGGARPAAGGNIALANDAPRLTVEAFIVGLQERLVNVVVRRHVLIARIKLRVNEGKIDAAAQLIDELRRLDSQQQFLLALDQEQQKSVSSDPLVQRKIDRMFADARKLVGQYLDPREVSRTEIEVDEAPRTAGRAAGENHGELGSRSRRPSRSFVALVSGRGAPNRFRREPENAESAAQQEA